MHQFFTSDCQSIGASALASVLPTNIPDCFPSEQSPCSLRDSQVSSPTPQFKSINSSMLSLLYGSTLTSIRDYWKNHIFEYTDICLQRNVSIFWYASTLLIAFLPRSKRFLLSWLKSRSAVILKPKNRKSVTVWIVFPSICHEVMGPDAVILVF